VKTGVNALMRAFAHPTYLRIKLIAGTSLCAWVAVLVCGRLITFFRPPFFH
jgi:hypothetical protein